MEYSFTTTVNADVWYDLTETNRHKHVNLRFGKKDTSHGLYLSTRKEGGQYQVTNCLTITDRCNCDSLLTFPRFVKIASINSTKPDTTALNRWPNTNQWCGSLQPKSNSFWLILPSFFINDYSIGKQFAKNHIIDPSQVTL